jgi:hypothetical protein
MSARRPVPGGRVQAIMLCRKVPPRRPVDDLASAVAAR